MNMLLKFAVTVAATLSVCLAFASAGAQLYAQQSPEPLPKTARDHSARAIEAFKAGNYEAAGRHFLDAHALAADPVLLYNAAYAYGRSGDLKLALDLARRAEVAGLPEAKTATRNAARRDGWQIVRRATAGAEAIAASPAGGNGAARSAVDPSGIDLSTSASPSPADESSQSSLLFWAGTTTATIGAGLLATAVVYDLEVASSADELDDVRQRGDFAAEGQLLSDIDQDQQTGRIFAYTGAGLLAGGLAMLTYSLLDDGAEDGVRPTVGVGHKSGQVGLMWRY